MAEIKEDYMEQFSAGDREEAVAKAQAAAERARERGMTWPQVTWFDDYHVKHGPDVGKTLFVFQAWRERPRHPDTCAPAHPMLVPVEAGA